MVLEKIFGRDLLENESDVASFLGFIFVLVGFITSFLIFYSGMSIAMIGFSSMLVVPYVIKILSPEDSKYVSVFDKKSGIIKFYMFMFFGMAFAYTILFGILKPDIQKVAFENQLDVINYNFVPKGNFSNPWGAFWSIVSNNMLIVAIAILLSFVYGTGSIFILNYNASIAGIVYGNLINVFIWGGNAVYTHPYLYLPHTIVEILAYLLAAIAGGIMTKPITEGNRRLITRDSMILTIVAVALIFFGGYLEINAIDFVVLLKG